ncbi:MAG TPA: hypothetical protein PLI71_09855 [Clostridia bacterium]|nr:hypothetical protein [Clostridia bacterium]
MAFLKTITTPHGVECKYHRVLISGLEDLNYLQVKLVSYVDEEKRKADCPPVWYQIYQVEMEKDLVDKDDAGKTLTETIKSIAYRKLKKMEQWSDAENV